MMYKNLCISFLFFIAFQVIYLNNEVAEANDLNNLRHLLYAPYNDKLRIGDSFDNMDYHSLLHWNQLSKMKTPYTRNIRTLLNSPRFLMTSKRTDDAIEDTNKDMQNAM